MATVNIEMPPELPSALGKRPADVTGLDFLYQGI
jgi:hypothetical protein